MKSLVVYDSVFGNTEKIALQVVTALMRRGEVRSLRAKDAEMSCLEGIELLIVGSPTRKFRPTENIAKFLKGLPRGSLQGVKGAAFDTRIDLARIRSPLFRFIVDRAGYAAKPIASWLKRAGAEVEVDPEGFFVEGNEGPLKAGELERADHWAAQVK